MLSGNNQSSFNCPIIFYMSSLNYFTSLLQYYIIEMQEDSLLSNISNVSYYGNHQNYNGNDFFNKSLPVGQV